MDFHSIGLFILRISFGLSMAFAHGMPKLLNFTNKMHTFPDPFGIGSTLSLSLAVGAELLCAIAVAFGIFTRVLSIPLVITMAVAVFIFHGADPFAKKELAALYLIAFSCILCTGPGKYSIDGIFRGVS